MIDHLSASQLVMFQRCAEQWRRRFLEEDFAPPAIPVLVGRTVREVALAALRRKLDADAFPTPEELADLAADAFNRRAADGVYVAPEELSSVRASLAEAKNAALALVALFRAELVPQLDPVLADERVALDLGLPMPVAVDLHCLNRNGEAHHIATASKRWNPDRAHASPDPALRREALRQRSGAAPASLICDVLVSSRTPALQRIETSRAPGDLLAVIRAFRFMLNAIDAGIFPPAPPESWICSPRWCPYFYSCSHVPARRKILPVGVHGAGARLLSVVP